MKKIITVVSAMLMFCFVFSGVVRSDLLGAAAYADYGCSIPSPCADTLRAVGDNIVYPKTSSYLKESEAKEVFAPHGDSVYFYWAPKADGEHRRSFDVDDGTKVTVLAREKGLSCVVFSGYDGNDVSGWITSTNLRNVCNPALIPYPVPSDKCQSESEKPSLYNPTCNSKSTTKYVQSTGGVCIYLRYGPAESYEAFDTINEGTAVTVAAEQGCFSYVTLADGRCGWCKTALLTSDTPMIAVMPALTDCTWTYVRSYRLSGMYQCEFHSDGTYDACNPGECRFSGKYVLEGRRLTVDGLRFIWNGKEFVSTEKQEMPHGYEYYTITPCGA